MLYAKIKQCIYLIFLGLLFIIDNGSAKSLIIRDFKPPETSKVVWMDSITVSSMKLDFFRQTKAGQLVGRVFGLPQATITKARFQLRDKAGAIFFEEKVDLSAIKQGKLRFDLDIKDVKITPETVLTFEIYGKRDRLMGRVEQKVPRQENFTKTKISALSIKLVDGHRIVSFLVETEADTSLFTPVVELYDRTGKKLQKTVKGGALSSASSIVHITIPEPATPQVYTIKAFLQDKNGEKSGGTLEGHFYVEGLFAQINYFDLLEEDLKSKKVSFVFAGTTLPVGDIKARIRVVQKWENEEVAELKDEKLLKVAKNGNFKGGFTFTLTQKASIFVADIELSKKGKIIGQKHLERKMFIDPSILDGIEAQKKSKALEGKIEKVKWWVRKDWFLYGGGALILFLIAINGWLRLHRRFFMIFVGVFFVTSQALAFPTSGVGAQLWWKYPVTSWFFNPNPDTTGVPNAGFGNYAKVRMSGSILSSLLLDSAPLFAPANTKPGFTLVHLTKGTQEGYVAIDMTGDFNASTGNGFSVTDNVRFEFELNTEADTLVDATPLKTFLTDGDWDYEVYFCIGGTGVSCSGGVWYGSTARTLKIDQTSPILNFKYDNNPQQRLHKPRVEAAETLLATKINTRDAARATLLSKESERNQKADILSDKKNRIEPYKSMKKDKLITKKGIIAFKIKQINSSFMEINPFSKPLSCMQLFAIRRDSLMSLMEVNSLCALRNHLLSDYTTVSHDISAITAELQALNVDIDLLTTQVSALTSEIESIQATITTLEDSTIPDSIPDLQQRIKSVKSLSKSKAEGILLNFTCNESLGSNCMKSNYEIHVRGNFCDDSTICDTTGTRKIKVCDKAGNCIDPETHANDIDWYDAVKPEVPTRTLPSGLVRASESQAFVLTTVKELRRSLSSTQAGNSTADYNNDACGYTGDGIISPLFNNGSYCIEKFSTCGTSAVDRGEQNLEAGGSCASYCEPGYIYDTGICFPACDQRNLELCLPGILGRGDCVDDPSSWSPATSTRPAGVPFMQENNCGKRRQAIGSA